MSLRRVDLARLMILHLARAEHIEVDSVHLAPELEVGEAVGLELVTSLS